jgi:hypothetical protein
VNKNKIDKITVVTVSIATANAICSAPTGVKYLISFFIDLSY